MIEDHLGESLTGGSLSELSVESERFHNGKLSYKTRQYHSHSKKDRIESREGGKRTHVSLDGVHRRSGSLLLREDVSSLLVEGRVNTSESGFGTLHLDHVDRLLQSWRGEESRSVDDSSTSRDELT